MSIRMPDEAQDSRNGHATPGGDGQSLAVQGRTSFAVQTAEHVRQIVTAAETSVERVQELAQQERREIEEQALRRLEAADRLAELADERLRRIVGLGEAVFELGGSIRTEMNEMVAALERAEAAKRRVDDLAEALREEIAQVESSSEPTPAAVSEGLHTSAAPAANGSGDSRRSPAAKQPAKDARARLDDINPGKDARATALHMAMGGKTREEVEAELARGSATSDLEQILDEVFGVGTGGGHTIAWRASSPVEGA